MALQRPVILMRPGEANNRLAGVLLKEGIECWRWPAFRIELPGKEDCDLVQERLDNLDDVEMVILPSPASVAAAAHWVKAWPEHITLATVGEGTAKVIRAAWGDDVKLIYPEGDAEDLSLIHIFSRSRWSGCRARSRVRRSRRDARGAP